VSYLISLFHAPKRLFKGSLALSFSNLSLNPIDLLGSRVLEFISSACSEVGEENVPDSVVLQVQFLGNEPALPLEGNTSVEYVKSLLVGNF